MCIVKIFFLITVCLEFLTAYPPPHSERNFESNETKTETFGGILQDTTVVNKTAMSSEIENIAEHTTVLNNEEKETEIIEKLSNEETTKTIKYESNIHKNRSGSKSTETITAANNKIRNNTATTTIEKLEHSNVEKNVLNNITNHTTMVNKDATTNYTKLITLSDLAGNLMNTGQTIKSERSKSDDTAEINPVGVEILKNLSASCGGLLGKRISFGMPTTLMQYPWTVLLVYNNVERYHCGGSLITERFVLTAAHCVAQEFYELSSVRLGEHDITMEKDCAEDVASGLICSNTIDVNIIKIIIHHEYSRLSHKNDIALLKMERNVESSRSYYPICLPNPDENVLEQREAIVAGWGATEKTLRSNVLLMANVPILDMSKCREVYRYTQFNDTTELCGSGATEIDVCNGDSGGALFFERTSRRGKIQFVQMGIISLGVRQCGDSRFFPAVFTKLPAYIKWIENNLEL